MQEWIGHIAAALFGGIILLLLAGVAWRGQHHAVSSAQYAAAKGSLLNLVEVMEEDFSNMGAGRRNNTLRDAAGYGAFVDDASFHVTASPYSVRFYTWPDTAAAIDPAVDHTHNVEYRWTEADSLRIKGDSTGLYHAVPAYSMTRYVNGVAAGTSFDTITALEVTLYDGAGAEVTPAAVAATPTLLNSVRAVEVLLRAVSPLGGGKGYDSDEDAALRYQVDETRFHRVYRPLNLARVPTS